MHQHSTGKESCPESARFNKKKRRIKSYSLRSKLVALKDPSKSEMFIVEEFSRWKRKTECNREFIVLPLRENP